jgi:protein TonB
MLALLLAVQACNVESPTQEAVQEFELPAPSVLARPELREGPTFTPFTVAPSILNRSEVVEAMNAEYPPLLRGAGIGGSVVVWMFVNELGKLEEVRLQESSGHRALDEAALNVAETYRFSPARNRDEPVPVWVQFPITFQTSLLDAEAGR